MTLRHIFFFFFTLLVLVSCNSENETLVITFEEATGITAGQPVLIKGFQIGEVTKISLSRDYKIDVEIFLNDTIHLPNDSKFTLESVDIFNKAIIVKPGKSKTFYKPSDKIIGTKQEPIQVSDSIVTKIEEEILRSLDKKN